MSNNVRIVIVAVHRFTGTWCDPLQAAFGRAAYPPYEYYYKVFKLNRAQYDLIVAFLDKLGVEVDTFDSLSEVEGFFKSLPNTGRYKTPEEMAKANPNPEQPTAIATHRPNPPNGES